MQTTDMRFAKLVTLGFTGRMWSKFINPFQQTFRSTLLVGTRTIPLLMIRHSRARRYLLRLRQDGTARVTIPRGGTQAEARRFVEKNLTWLEEQFQRQQTSSSQPATWHLHSKIWLRGEQVCIEPAGPGQIRFGNESLAVDNPASNLRPAIETHLRARSAQELPPRVAEFSALHGLTVKKITVRNQRSRWGSCSRRGTISLNWRLIQTPAFVRDYIILHELAHLRHMNHSDRFWREVEQLCPDYRAAETWLKQHRGCFH